MLPHDLTQALTRLARPLAATPGLHWLLGGSAALVLHGVALPAPPRDLDLLCDPAGAARIAAALTDASAGPALCTVLQPLSFSAEGVFSGTRGRYALDGVEIDVVADVCVSGADGTLCFKLEAVWPLRATMLVGDVEIAVLPLEYKLAVELLRGRAERARLIAAHLHQRGFAWDAFSTVLAAAPGLETPLWETLNAVVPLSRRAAKRRAIRKAEREEIDYFLRKKK